MPLASSATILVGGEALPAQVSDISMGGTGLLIDTSLPIENGTEAVLEVRLGSSEPVHQFHAIVRSQRPLAQRTLIGVEFAHRSSEEVSRKVALVAGSSDRWVEFQRRRERRLGIGRTVAFLFRLGFRYSRSHMNARLRQERAQLNGEFRAIGRTIVRFFTGEPLRQSKPSSSST
jgi:hypothetical protein